MREQRTRKLPARLVVWLCILMHLFSRQGLVAVLRQSVKGTRLVADETVEVLANKSSISKARYRIGSAPLKMVFEAVCHPLATRQTPGAFVFGRRVVALDGSVETVADTPENQRYFGRQAGTRRTRGSAYPQVRCVYACECGTHAIFDAEFLPYRYYELKGAQRLLRSITAEMLVLLDTGLYSFDLFEGIVQRGADLLVRARRNVRPRCVERLSDGTYLADISPSKPVRHHTARRLRVRVIEYTLDDPDRPGHGEPHRLVTTLLDPNAYPALDLIVLYHDRWEIEITIDELDTHQRLCEGALRSHKPDGVLQELYGLLVGHYVIRCLMAEAAHSRGLDPRRLSFIESVRLIQDAVAECQLVAPCHLVRLHQRLRQDIAYYVLPQRDNRINPRVVKRKCSKFKTKRPHHLHPPPLRPFREAVLLVGSP